ncbi:phosphatase PAP2 family protein [Tenacibaculum maritimum]|uniref:Phosphatidic acid phosphatase type 2/haloperoxidase domain-containing protein n=3 Tax=Tenacibaculum maritimum TaxID=107401 RepID=A0A2H1EB31_9FLAO|nr:phosphatase PAP2 family protein [Tenacibaculum maritimum]CAA0143561.1 putative membrane-associated phospholipid phosphatase [Tenacibaculum maritimum]CAA0143906.1 putative membrane-associated phospholipid phosphatase [Tenacibaculum maritimum]CAA0144570.1 putative membrane-associated phospholipid phosphatase [Tenacibaculum maritimum]CAA0158588.1 putative membrane-associated phospholipid phosphatase [Tenacibaculum maritimum]CAA0167382.1 putative membrane-associated phospholipid phosphatase [Te
MIENLLQRDRELLIYLNNLGSEQWDAFWLFITNQFNWIPLFAFIIYLIFKAFGWKKGGMLLLVLIIMVAFSDQYTNFIRGVFERLRPNNDITINHLLRPKLINPQSFSFTSGHATTSTAFSVFIILLLKKRYAKIKFLVFFPLIFAYSRIYLGVHFPVDIFCGAINGLLIGVIFYKVALFLIDKKLKTI